MGKNIEKSNDIYETHISSITVDLTIVISRKKKYHSRAIQ